MRDRDLLGFPPAAGAAMSSAAALLLLPILAAAGEGAAACPTQPAAAVILRHASTSCRTVDALGLRGHRAGVVEVGFALSFDLAIALAEKLASGCLCCQVAVWSEGILNIPCRFASIHLCDLIDS